MQRRFAAFGLILACKNAVRTRHTKRQIPNNYQLDLRETES
jgi:hypothetical protein